LKKKKVYVETIFKMSFKNPEKAETEFERILDGSRNYYYDENIRNPKVKK